MIDQLVHCGLLEQEVVRTYAFDQFAEDLIAEYLAAMYVFGYPDRRLEAGLRRRSSFAGSSFAEALEQVKNWEIPFNCEQDVAPLDKLIG